MMLRRLVCTPILAIAGLLIAGQSASLRAAEVTARLGNPSAAKSSHPNEKVPPAVIWLQPVETVNASAASIGRDAPDKFTLLQKNKMFSPHLLVVPVGSSVSFPNADPFFHNVFSLFDGKRFDLGLYEAGSTRTVVFSREGVSFIFCNIHSEMSAVVIALSTPFYAVADRQGEFELKTVPDGLYDLHVWVEGQRQDLLDQRTRRVRVSGDTINLGTIPVDNPDHQKHLNKFGRPYEPDPDPVY
jgi:plastocyanin